VLKKLLMHLKHMLQQWIKQDILTDKDYNFRRLLKGA
jgi:hypothetical protein